MKKETTKHITRIAIFTAILSILSQITLPSPTGLPITLQVFGVCLCGFFLGAKNGFSAVLAYVLLGICGMPVFSHFSGGIQHLLSQSGGFITGFLPLVVFCGLKTSKNTQSPLIFGFLGLLICYILGISWFCNISKVNIMTAFLANFLFFLKDIALCIAAFFAAKIIKSRIK